MEPAGIDQHFRLKMEHPEIQFHLNKIMFSQKHILGENVKKKIWENKAHISIKKICTHLNFKNSDWSIFWAKVDRKY